MNKDYLVKILTIMSVVLLALIAVVGLLIAVVSKESMVRMVGVCIFIGVLIGGIIKCIYIIPKKYTDKDERTIVVYLISNLMSNAVFGISSYLYLFFMLTKVLVVELRSPIVMISITGSILLLTILTEKISYYFIEKRL